MTASGETSLPSSWAVAEISDIAHINPKLNKSNIDDKLEVSFVPMPSVEEGTGRIDLATSRRFSDVKKGYTAFQEGDVLFAKITPCMENGKMAVVPALTNGYGFGSTEFHVLRPFIGVMPSYLYYFVSSRKFRSDAEHNMTGAVGQRRVPTKYLSEQRIPIPPTNEQRRIVAKVKELFSVLDKGIEALSTARQQLNAFRQAVLRHAFSGKLTADWRRRNARLAGSPQGLESALTSAAAVKVSRISGDELEEVRQIPPEWAYFRVASLCSVVRGGSPRPAGDPTYYGGSIPFLKVADLTRTPGMHVSTHTSTIKEAGLSKTRMTPPNTLLISNSGATLGVPKICTFETTFNDGVAAFLGLPKGYLEYFYFFWESKTSELRGIDQGAAQPNLNTSILGETLIPMCSKEEAKEVVALLQATLSTIEHQYEEIGQQLAQADTLRQAILNRAFEGKLVARDSNDEPASVLLERIRRQFSDGAPRKKHYNSNGEKKAA